MNTFIKLFAAAMMLLFAGASFAQPAHPIAHHPVKHYRHYKHHKKVHPVRHPLHLPAPPPPPKLPPLPHR